MISEETKVGSLVHVGSPETTHERNRKSLQSRSI